MDFTHYQNFLPAVSKAFPGINEQDLSKILDYGFRSFYLNTLYGADIYMKTQSYCIYSGKVFSNNKDFFSYWQKKRRTKLRLKYKRSKKKYEGYYYFFLTNDQIKNYSIKKDKPFIITMYNLYAFKLLDELLTYHCADHIFRFKYPTDVGFIFTKDKLKLKNVEYIGTRVNNKVHFFNESTYSK